MMFACPTKESTTGHVDFVKESKKTMKTLIQFLYHGQVAECDASEELLKLAHMMDLTALRDDCDRALAHRLKLNESNVFDIFRLAHTYSAAILKRNTGLFLFMHFGIDGLNDQLEWKSIKEAHPEMVFEFLETTVAFLNKRK